MAQTNVDHFRIRRDQISEISTWLKDFGWLSEELDTTITKQAAMGSRHRDGGRSAETPMPLNIAASDAAMDLKGTLADWILKTCRGGGLPHPGRLRTPEASKWLRRNIMTLAKLEDAPDAYREIDTVHARTMAVIDRPRVKRVLAGFCPNCREDVECEPGTEHPQCPTCGLQLTEEQIHADIDYGADQIAVTAKEAAELINLRYDTTFKPKTVYDMADRKTNPVTPIKLDSGQIAFWLRDIVTDLKARGKIA